MNPGNVTPKFYSNPPNYVTGVPTRLGWGLVQLYVTHCQAHLSIKENRVSRPLFKVDLAYIYSTRGKKVESIIYGKEINCLGHK